MPSRLPVLFTLAVVAAIAAVGIVTHSEPGDGLWFGMHAEFLPFLPVLVVGLLIAWRTRPTDAQLAPAQLSDFLMLTVVGVAAAFSAGRVWLLVVGEPVVYHDEASYLLQAETFAAGRLTADGLPDAPQLLDQMHVVSDEVRFSRYFPGTAIWLAPWAAIGLPRLGQVVAHVVASLLVALTGREIGSRRAGLIAGLAFGLSPGLTVFSSHLLAHHPTLIGLTLFLWQLFVALRTGHLRSFAIAAIGLSAAMICRPMTAAGFALPFGVVLLRHAVHRGQWQPLAAMAAPIVAGLGLLGLHDVSTTGELLTTPYSVYNARHSPRHVYGFGNGTRGDAAAALADRGRRLAEYDQWAANLDASLAIDNVATRCEASLRLTLGVVPLLVALGIVLATPPLRRVDGPLPLLVASIGSLHLVHVPYWFVGIDDWHYVLESAVPWCLIAGLATEALAGWRPLGRWWLSVLAVAAVLNQTSLPPVWYGEQSLSLARDAFSISRYRDLGTFLDSYRDGRPTVVAIRKDPTQIHFDYVRNGVSLDDAVVVLHLRTLNEIPTIERLFPDRRIVVLDQTQPRDKQLTVVRP